jgi:hypothetical protein
MVTFWCRRTFLAMIVNQKNAIASMNLPENAYFTPKIDQKHLKTPLDGS